MPVRTSIRRSSIISALLCLAVLATLVPLGLRAQDADNPTPERHGRKYKAPPETSHIEVTVIKGFNKKPIDGAHVIFHPVKDGKDIGNLELKTHQDGKTVIDVIPTGSSVRIQVLADGFSTFADDFLITEPSREIVIAMERPKAQISTYVDNSGKNSELQPGVQEPVRPKKPTSTKPSTSTNSDASSKPQN